MHQKTARVPREYCEIDITTCTQVMQKTKINVILTQLWGGCQRYHLYWTHFIFHITCSLPGGEIRTFFWLRQELKVSQWLSVLSVWHKVFKSTQSHLSSSEGTQNAFREHSDWVVPSEPKLTRLFKTISLEWVDYDFSGLLIPHTRSMRGSR